MSPFNHLHFFCPRPRQAPLPLSPALRPLSRGLSILSCRIHVTRSQRRPGAKLQNEVANRGGGAELAHAVRRHRFAQSPRTPPSSLAALVLGDSSLCPRPDMPPHPGQIPASIDSPSPCRTCPGMRGAWRPGPPPLHGYIHALGTRSRPRAWVLRWIGGYVQPCWGLIGGLGAVSQMDNVTEPNRETGLERQK